MKQEQLLPLGFTKHSWKNIGLYHSQSHYGIWIQIQETYPNSTIIIIFVEVKLLKIRVLSGIVTILNFLIYCFKDKI